MASVSTQVLTHLDPPERYAVFDTQFDGRVYIRFTVPEPCLTHVQIHADSSQRKVHFFLPDSETEQIKRPIRGFNDTRIYLYCVDKDSVTLNRNTFRPRALYNIFTADRLEFHLNAAQVELFYELALEAPDGSARRDEWASTASRQVNRIKDIFQQHINAQLGEEPAELIRDDNDPPII